MSVQAAQKAHVPPGAIGVYVSEDGRYFEFYVHPDDSSNDPCDDYRLGTMMLFCADKGMAANHAGTPRLDV